MTAYITTVCADLTEGRYKPQGYTVHYSVVPGEDQWRHPVTDICIESVYLRGVDIEDSLTEAQMLTLERAIRAQAEADRAAQLEAAA